MEPLRSVTISTTPQVPPGTIITTQKTDTPVIQEERFISSDMAQMLDDLQRVDPTYVKSTPVKEEKPSTETSAPQAERYMSPDMSQMVDDIKRAEETLTRDSFGTKLMPAGQQESNPVVLTADLQDFHDNHGHHENHKPHLIPHGLTGVHLGIEGAEAGGLLIQGTATHTSTVSEAVAHGVETASHSAEAATEGTHLAAEGSHVASHVSALLVGGAIASGVVAAGMTALGIHSIKEGITHKDKEKILEGSGETILGAKSAASALTMAGHGAGEGILGAIAHGAHTVLTPLGIAHGAIDVTLGAKKIYDGKKHKDKGEMLEGFLEMGQGVAIGGAALGGGVPAILIAMALLGTKMLVHHHNQKKEQAHARADSPTMQAPGAHIEHTRQISATKTGQEA
jgi:hypothetical protein